MHFDSTDALVLQCIFRCETNEKGASLGNIISYGDYVNHAILSWKEIATSTAKLGGAGLIGIQEKNIYTMPVFRKWHEKRFEGKKTVSVQKETNEILKFLEKNHVPVNAAWVPIPGETDYNEALEQYMNRQ